MQISKHYPTSYDFRLGEVGNKPYTTWNYIMLILFYQQIQHDKLRWNTNTNIIRIEQLVATE